MAGQLDPIQLMRKIAELEDKINAMRTIEVGGVWQDYTVEWTASITNPDIGDGVLLGKYTLIGKACTLAINMIAGSTTTFGSGGWMFSLPFTTGIYASVNNNHVGSGIIRDVSPQTQYILTPTLNRSVTVIQYFRPLNGSVITSTSPITWAVGDYLHFQITYEIA